MTTMFLTLLFWRHLRRRFAAVLMVLVLAAAAQSHAATLCGHWKGEWHGCTDGLHGTVNAKITKIDACHYKAVFWGRAFKVMPYRYTSTLTAWKDPESGKMRFKVKQKLGIWSWYWMKGWSDNCTFFARYHTDDHVGYFKMKRVGD
ncbi:MAG: hypothetical protein KDA44_20420 [Planctomycetales bacterium]|nr:hypothetical protein [Planctomycetales bacterium]